MVASTPSGAVRLRWVGPVAFAKQHPGPHGVSVDVDVDLGEGWGPRHDQRVSGRHAPGSSLGLLYAYDSLWDEYAVLATDVSRDTVDAVSRLLNPSDHPSVTVDVLAECARWLAPTPRLRVDAPAAEPEL